MNSCHSYGPLDRLLHHLAFCLEPAQFAVAEIEDRIFRDCLAQIDSESPVFITALPRSGTTLLLELLSGLDEFATHTYRNMPFVGIPMLWNRVTEPFRRMTPRRERTHGDGMQIDADSPEAFEEVVWHAHWSTHYAHDRIIPWPAEAEPAFERAFINHTRKIIALKGRSGTPLNRRYVSNNNLNIARIPLLRNSFPSATILVPYRDPLAHARSLHAQHIRFLELHRRDRFSRRYMAAIGHYDLGANLRPVDFDGWLNSADTSDATSLSFWIEYWTATYESLHMQARNHTIVFVAYEAMCRNPAIVLRNLAEVCGIRDASRFVANAARIAPLPRPPRLARAMPRFSAAPTRCTQPCSTHRRRWPHERRAPQWQSFDDPASIGTRVLTCHCESIRRAWPPNSSSSPPCLLRSATG